MVPRAIRDFFQRCPCQGVVVAVSGGPDSVALLHALVESRQSLVLVAHFNHGLRGSESDGDEALVRELATTLDLPYRGTRIDTRVQAQNLGANLERTARELRYDWLAKVALEVGADCVATGHTANDQAETVLHRILRGSSLRGLRGIAEVRPLKDSIRLVRPMLGLTREQIVEYLQSLGQTWRHDSTNSDTAFTRNRLRHDLLPLLERDYNPRVVEALTHLAQHAQFTYGEFERLAREVLTACERPRAGTTLVFDRRALASSSPTLVREMLHLVWERESWPLDAMGFADWDRLLRVALGDAQAVDLPGGIQARCKEHVLQVGPSRR